MKKQPIIAKGFLFSGIHAGIKKEKKDLGLIFSELPAVVAGATTKNQVVAAPVILSREVIKSGKCRAFLVNSGNANAYTADQGYENAKNSRIDLAKLLKIKPEEMAVASTGIIGVQLPVEKIISATDKLVNGLGVDYDGFVHAILTTDLTEKNVTKVLKLGGKEIIINGFAKGSGMIAPNMATMLGFLTTDVAIDQKVLQKMVSKIVNDTFNMITVDSDTSTNDMVLIMANGAAKNSELTASELQLFENVLFSACKELALMIVRDGEGATKFIEVNVSGLKTDSDAKQLAMSIANSPLVKTAIFGENPNWGRIMMASGKSGIKFDQYKVSLRFGNIQIIKDGLLLDGSKEEARQYLKEKDIIIFVEFSEGSSSATAWTCDFSYAYVKINAEYN